MNRTPLVAGGLLLIGGAATLWLLSRSRQPRCGPDNKHLIPATSTPALLSLYPPFRAKVEKVVARLEAQGYQPVVRVAWRSPEQQQREVAEGDSEVSLGYHNAKDPCGNMAALGADVIDRRYGWTDPRAESSGFWDALQAAAEAEGMVTGNTWRKPWDPAHVQAYGVNSPVRNFLAQGGWPPPKF